MRIKTIFAVVGFLLICSVPLQADILMFREGVNSYSGTIDTYIDARAGDSDISHADREYFGVGNQGTTGNRQIQDLIRFDGIFGSLPGQIPMGSSISNAKLWLYIYPPDGESDCGVEIYRMLSHWDEDDTWDEWIGGIQPVTEAAVGTPDDYITDFPDPIYPPYQRWFSLDVTQSLQAWSSGEENLGWFLQSYDKTKSDGVPFCSSEYTDLGLRPYLEVSVVPAPSAVLLCIFGLSMIGVKLRRYI